MNPTPLKINSPPEHIFLVVTNSKLLSLLSSSPSPSPSSSKEEEEEEQEQKEESRRRRSFCF